MRRAMRLSSTGSAWSHATRYRRDLEDRRICELGSFALVAGVLNAALLLAIRIPAEERALASS
jgi:hypothetical protein